MFRCSVSNGEFSPEFLVFGPKGAVSEMKRATKKARTTGTQPNKNGRPAKSLSCGGRGGGGGQRESREMRTWERERERES